MLDPAAGSGNFLYVTLEHLKRLEGDVLERLAELGQAQGTLELEGEIVRPEQFFGIEVNPRAAAISELVLWIGYLQWHLRTHGGAAGLPEPILRNLHTSSAVTRCWRTMRSHRCWTPPANPSPAGMAAR